MKGLLELPSSKKESNLPQIDELQNLEIKVRKALECWSKQRMEIKIENKSNCKDNKSMRIKMKPSDKKMS